MKREDEGSLSAYERRQLIERIDAPVEVARARAHYNEMLAIAKQAREELAGSLMRDVAPAVRLPEQCRLANTFAWAARELWLAAQQVVDIEDLHENGKAEGVVWEIKL